MRRRDLILLLGAGVVRSGGVLAQQQPRTRRIGFLTPRAQPQLPAGDAFSAAFIAGMRDLGYREGENFIVEWRYTDGDYKRLTGAAVELVKLDLPVIVAYGTAAAKALKSATETVPIVVAAAVDLVGAGIVGSLARPGGNITGLSVISVDLSAKQLGLLKAASPTLTRVAVLSNPGNSSHGAVLQHVQTAATPVGISIVSVDAATPVAIDQALASAAQQGATAVLVAADGFFSGQGARLAAGAQQHRLATISLYQDHVIAGCLMSYGPNVAAFHRQAARYVDKILKGAKPEELPVEQPTKIDLMLNAKTAAALGLPLPRDLLVMADEVIE